MKQINDTKSVVFLSTYDNSDTLLPVSEEHKNTENICVAVKFSDILIKISPNTTCQCSWDEAIEKHSEELMSPVFWQIIGVVQTDVAKALKMLGHDELKSSWTYSEYSSYSAWFYYANYGLMHYINKGISYSVRPAKVFKIEE